MPFIRSQLLFLLCLACAGPLRAQVQPADSARALPESRLDEITVTASRIGVNAAAAPQRVTVLNRDTIERSGARHAADLLAARAGLFIRQYGEGLATLSLRGAGPSQTLILLDGMRMTDPQLGQLDLSLFPTFALSGVEITHGPGSALFGSDGIGGIVNLRPRKPVDDELRLSSEIGAYGERRVGGGGSWRDGRKGVFVAAEYATADGDFPYINEALFPPREVRRRNADRQTRSVYATTFSRAASHRIEASVLFADAARGLPGLATVDPSGERQWDKHVRVWVSDEVGLDHGRLAVRGFMHRSYLRYANPSIAVDDTGQTWTGAVEIERVLPVSGGWIVDGGLSAGYAKADHPMLSEAASELHGAAFAEAVGRIGAAMMYPALRADAYGFGSDHRRLALSPRLALNVPLLDHTVHLKAGFGRAFRNPTFNDRYWQPGGNPSLAPERAWSYEAGAHVTIGSSALTGEITASGARTRDQIVWTPRPSGIWAPENLAETSSHSLETSAQASARIGRAILDGGGTYTLTHAVDRSDSGSRTFGRQLRYVPRHLVKGLAGITRGALRFDASLRWIGRRYVTADESEWMDPSLVLDLQAGVRRAFDSIRIDLALLLENALDADYAVIQNYPMPPRHARVRLVIQTK